MTGLFEVLAGHDAEEQERRTGTRAAIAAQTRAKARFEGFLSKAAGQSDFEARLALIDSNLRDLANETAAEYDGDPERTYLAATAVLGGGHASDCSCGFCENMGKLPGQSDEDEEEEEGVEKESSKKCHYCLGDGLGAGGNQCPICKGTGKEPKEKESSVKTSCSCGCGPNGCDCENCPVKEQKVARWSVVAADVEEGDHYQSERVSLPSADDDALGGPSPKIDKGKSGDHTGWDLDPIDVGSVRNKLEKQDASDPAEYNDSDFLRDLDSPIHDDADVTKSVSPPDMDRTKTWTGTEGQASPVTSSDLTKWRLVE